MSTLVGTLAPTLEAFFTQRLLTQRRASPHTIAAYRDTFCLLLDFAQRTTGTAPAALRLDDLDAPLISSLGHCGGSTRPRRAVPAGLSDPHPQTRAYRT